MNINEVAIHCSEYPEKYTCHIRDPKVWKDEKGYHMVLGGRQKGDHGAVLFYRSQDLKNWEFDRELTTEDAFGYMWECPDADDDYTNPTASEEKWQHCLTVPREITVKNNMLYQWPVEEINTLRGNHTELTEESPEAKAEGPFDLNGGEVVFSTRYYPESLKQNVKVDAESVHGRIYRLNFMTYTEN